MTFLSDILYKGGGGGQLLRLPACGPAHQILSEKVSTLKRRTVLLLMKSGRTF